MSIPSPFALGATLYMPATREDILDLACGSRIPDLRSLVVCLEDAVAATDVDSALANLKGFLARLDARGGRPQHAPLLFVRPRDARMAALLNDWPLMKHVDGFVVPKLTLGTLPAWAAAVSNPALCLMPTLETADVYDPAAMVDLGQALNVSLARRIIALRIGGNDLLGCLGLRRNPCRTLYSTPMAYVISMLAGVMGAQGFALTAPVFERLDTPQLLREELALDLAHGLVGKTAIHPRQIVPIQQALRVSSADLHSARLIVNDAAPAVFLHDDVMCEPATHGKWALNIIERARWHGVEPAAHGADECRLSRMPDHPGDPTALEARGASPLPASM